MKKGYYVHYIFTLASLFFLVIIKLLVVGGANRDIENNYGNSPRKIVLDAHKNIPLVGDPKEWDLQPHLNW